jgi:hypothetical protein
MDRYYDHRVRDDIANALRTVRTILDDTRNPQYPADVAHRYEDKFALTEFLMRTGVAAVFQGLNGLGVAGEHLVIAFIHGQCAELAAVVAPDPGHE